MKDHLMYLDAVQEFADWLHSAKEELHRWSDTSGDPSATQKKLLKIKVSILADSFLHRPTGSSHWWQICDKDLVVRFWEGGVVCLLVFNVFFQVLLGVLLFCTSATLNTKFKKVIARNLVSLMSKLWAGLYVFLMQMYILLC